MKFHKALDQDDKFNWTKGSMEQSQLPSEVQQHFDQIVMPYYFKLLENEDDKSVIERVLESIRDMSIDFGPAVF